MMLLSFQPGALSEAHVAQIQAAAPDTPMLITQDRDEIEAVLDEVEIAAGDFPHDLLPGMRNLRWLQQFGAGADWLLRYPEAVEMDFVLTNASGVAATPISEHILASLLSFARGLLWAAHAQAPTKWEAHWQWRRVFELAGKTMVLIGVGAIGGQTAKVATALGVRVLGVRRNPAIDAPGVAAMYGPDQLLDVLPEGDFVVLAIPLTRETQRMIGEREFRAMKPTAYIVNIGRGGIIQESALIDALREGQISGAGLDVFETEPLPEESPLWAMDNVIVTSHYAGATPHYYPRVVEILVDNLQRYRSGEALRNVVDKALGY